MNLLFTAVHKKESDFLLVNQGMAMLRIPYQTTRTDMGRPIHMHPNQMLIGKTLSTIGRKAPDNLWIYK